jgi:hypothetical protein
LRTGIEFDGVRVARLLPGLRLSLLDRLTEAFDSIDEDAATVAELEERLAAQSEAREAAPSGAGNSQMHRARCTKPW